jgi:V8-like Glu-specific endopeptidase
MSLKFYVSLCTLVFVFVSSQAFAFPKPRFHMDGQRFAQISPSGNFRAATFHSIVALSNCSGSFVRFVNSNPADKGMVMTNGHCLDDAGFIQPGEVRVDVPASRSFALLSDDGNETGVLRADRVLVATMTKTDITLYRLTQTYAEIAQQYGVQPLVISAVHPQLGTPIAVVSGYWKKIYSCQIDKFIYELHEADWTFKDSVRYSTPGCETIGGTSGSPIINVATGEVIGINNTGNDNGEKCTMDNPCEVDENGNVTVILHASYGQQTFWLYSCLDQNRKFNLNLPGCVLKP